MTSDNTGRMPDHQPSGEGVDAREYIDNHRAVIQEGVTRALRELDGSAASSVALLAGLSREELDEVGGVPESGVGSAA